MRITSRVRNRGISIYELLLVLVIAALLVVFFVYSSQSIVVRTKVSRVHEEHRLITRAVQNFQMDYSAAPVTLQSLRSPSRYLTSTPRDPFQSKDCVYIYFRVDGVETRGMLLSPGPDGDLDLPAELLVLVPKERLDPKLLDNFEQRTASLRAVPEGMEPQVFIQYIIDHYVATSTYDPEKGDDGDIVTLITY